MAEQNAKDRVYAAADQIAVDRNPTVATVREAAAVSNSDATRYLKQWREERATAGSTIAALPQPLAELALRLAGSMWAEASAIAATQHALLEAAWREEAARQEQDINELTTALDTTNRANADAATRQASQLEVARAESAAQSTDAATARAELAAAQAVCADKSNSLAIELAEARATITTLQNTQTALLARIPDLPT